MKIIRFIFLLVFISSITACSDNKPKLKALSKSATILAFGDSLTYGTGASQVDSYPSRLKQLIGFKVVNAGVSGEVSSDGKKRLGKLLDKHKPALVVLCHGGNDLLQKLDTSQTIDNLKAMIKMIKDSGAEVILLSVPKPGLMLKPAPFYEAIAEETKTPIILGLISEILSNRTLKSDTAHPNAKGYSEIAKSIADLLIERDAVSSLKQG